MTSPSGYQFFLRGLAICYLAGFFLHILDAFDLRLKFSEMNLVLKSWILYLAFFDLIAAIGLWTSKKWGIAAFLLIAISQLIAYLFFGEMFGKGEYFLMGFHALSLLIFFGLRPRDSERT